MGRDAYGFIMEGLDDTYNTMLESNLRNKSSTLTTDFYRIRLSSNSKITDFLKSIN